MRSRRFWLCFVVVVAVAVGFPPMLQSLRILHHRRGMTLLLEASWNNRRGPDDESPYPWYEYHRRELLMRREVSQRHFVMPHLRTGTREARHFVRMVMLGNHPPCIDWGSPCNGPSKSLRCEVWCENSDLSAWEEFIAKYDVPNYWDIRDPAVKIDETKCIAVATE